MSRKHRRETELLGWKGKTCNKTGIQGMRLFYQGLWGGLGPRAKAMPARGGGGNT